MCLLVETIKVYQRKFFNLEEHNRRFNRSRREVYRCSEALDLCSILSIPTSLETGVYKCRVTYSETVQYIEFIPYQPRVYRTLRLTYNDTIKYDYKYKDRRCFDDLLQKAHADDILIVKNGLLTDASLANIAFYEGTQWFTPAQPLLKGTKRQLLLDQKVMSEADLKPSDLSRFKSATLINAMLDIGNIPFISIENILPPL